MRFGTPLRYPGGKGKLTSYFERVLEENDIDGTYIEPYAGGAGIALNLLLNEKISEIVINDYDPSIYAFWKVLKEYPEDLIDKIKEVPVTVEEWDRQRTIQSNKQVAGLFQLGFSTFFLNRTNRSGVISGGVIGGREQTGPYRIDARFNKTDLIRRIKKINGLSDRITVLGLDANKLLKHILPRYDEADTLVYIDPPYYEKGNLLYMNYYVHSDHEDLEKTISGLKHRWILSYDDSPDIRSIYGGRVPLKFELNYSSYESRKGAEVFYTADDLLTPSGPVVGIGEHMLIDQGC
ncbi:MAG: DNA adenine methylase [Candidatus Methanoplasma sp.]|jgi:DNA adenine methylase|nr:DNA adenine methylase [Candidatus Methanoplasma sp.]